MVPGAALQERLARLAAPSQTRQAANGSVHIGVTRKNKAKRR
jgi:hypothetical protein